MHELSQESRKRILVGAWILIGLHFMALIGLVTDGQQYDPAIESFLSQSAIAAMEGPFDYLIKNNVLPVVAVAAGLILWKRFQSPEGRTIIGTGAMAVILGSISVIF